MTITLLLRSLRAFGAAAAVVALSGCATVYLVDNQVQSYARWADRASAPGVPVAVPQAPQIYRFERLPSQREGRIATGQDELERLAQQALVKVGWTRAAEGTASAQAGVMRTVARRRPGVGPSRHSRPRARLLKLPWLTSRS